MQMEFDFTTVLDRLGKDALAVDVMPYDNVQIREGFTKLPMWVADMNFATVPTVQEEIIPPARSITTPSPTGTPPVKALPM